MYTKKKRIINALISILIIISMLSGDLIIMCQEVMAVAENINLNDQTEDTLNKNVKFDAFFNQNNENTHYLTYNINDDKQNMYINFSVKEGYLKDAVIEFEDKNYTIDEIVDDGQIVQSATENQIFLKQLDENYYFITAKIATKLEEKVDLSSLNKDSKVILKAVYVNNKGEVQVIEKDITLNVKITGQTELYLQQSLKSCFTYNVNGENKKLIQIDAKLNSTKDNNNLPIKETKITAKVPEINGVKPERIKIIPKITQMTNGQDENDVKYRENQIEYNQDDATISIKIENQKKDENVKTANGQDEYLITYIYPQNNILELPTLFSNIEAKTILYSGEGEKEVSTVNQNQFSLNEEFGKPLDLELSTKFPNINKGKIYANTQMEQKTYETYYQSQWKVDITSKDIIDKIRVEDRSEYFKDLSGNMYLTSDLLNSYTHYATTIISKENFEKILGTDGTINIFNQNGDLISIINKDTEIDKLGNYVLTYPEQVEKIIMETSKPINEGSLYIEHIKVIEPDIPYTYEQFRMFNSIEEKENLVQIQGDNFNTISEGTLSINLEETSTNANIVLDKTTLSTLVTNENVEIKIELDNNRKESDLYINPTFLVELPEYIEDIDVKSANVLFDDSLQISNIEKINQDGKLFLRITLVGSQNGFSTGKFSKGTNIVLNTNIKAKLLTPSKEDTIKLYYSNPNAISYTNSAIVGEQLLGESEEKITYSAPVGMIAVSNISNYEDTGKTVTSVKQGTVTDKIEIYSKSRNDKMDLKLVNNTGNTCDNIVAIGRVPFKGNKNINSGDDLGTTVNTVLKSKISANGIENDKVKIYYSENGEATNDLSDSNNVWTLEPLDLSQVKSYMIILNGYQMETGEALDFSYDFEVPANLEYGNSLYGAFGATFENNTEVGIREETVIADTVGLTTGEGPKLDVAQVLYSHKKTDTVAEGEIIQLKILVSNTGSIPLEDVVIREYIPKYTKYAIYQKGSGDYGEVSSGYVYPQTKIEEGTNREYIDINVGKIDVEKIDIEDVYLLVENVPDNIEEYYDGEVYYDENTGKYYLEQLGDIQADGSAEVISKTEVSRNARNRNTE